MPTPRARRPGTTPGGRQQRFPGFEVLDQYETWDGVTAGVVLSRLAPPPGLRWFTPAGEAVGRALFDQLLDQREDPRIPILEMVDSRLAEAQTDGWHYADMPEDGEAFKRSFAALDDEARAKHGARFCELDWYDQADLVQYVQDRGGEDWRGLPASHVWSLWTRYACTAFYSHPWAWNEIGFGGPAYPRGYANLGVGRREHWEREDVAPQSPVGKGDELRHARREHTAVRERQEKTREAR